MSEGLYNPVSAARAAHARTRKGLMIAIGVSVFVHGAGVAWALSSSTPEPKRAVESAIPVQLVKLGKKRDPNMLPRLAAEPPPPAPEAVKLDTGKAPAASSAPRDRPKKTDDKLSDAARRLPLCAGSGRVVRAWIRSARGEVLRRGGQSGRSIALIVHDAVSASPGSTTVRPVSWSYRPALNASGAHVIGSTARPQR